MAENKTPKTPTPGGAAAGTTPKAKAMSKSAIFQELAGRTGLAKKQIAQVFEELDKLIKEQLGKKGTGVFTLPGLAKFRRKHVAARPETERPDPRNPGQMMKVKAKAAHTTVKATVLKALKEAK
jgi:nucleoid DNA-binding protein